MERRILVSEVGWEVIVDSKRRNDISAIRRRTYKPCPIIKGSLIN